MLFVMNSENWKRPNIFVHGLVKKRRNYKNRGI